MTVTAHPAYLSDSHATEIDTCAICGKDSCSHLNTATFVLYHAYCSDGFASAYVCWLQFGPCAEYLACAYGDPLPDLPDGARVFIVDFSFPRAVLEELAARTTLVVIDHHDSARDELNGLPCATFGGRSGCVLTWQHFNGDREIPEALRYVEDRDLWLWRMHESKAVNAAIATLPYDFMAWHICVMKIGVNELIREGKVALRLIDQQVQRQAESAKPVTMAGFDVHVANVTSFISETCHELLERHPGDHFVATYLDDKRRGMRVWSLRSRGFDVGALARMMGGGGHVKAAGFEEDLASFADIRPVLRQLEISGTPGNWDYNAYLMGMHNGMECAAAMLQGREPDYKLVPPQWGEDRPAPQMPVLQSEGAETALDASATPQTGPCHRCGTDTGIRNRLTNDWVCRLCVPFEEKRTVCLTGDAQ